MDWPEYEYIDETPIEGDWYTFLYCLGQEVDYLSQNFGTQERDAIPHIFVVGIDLLPTGPVRYLQEVTE